MFMLNKISESESDFMVFRIHKLCDNNIKCKDNNATRSQVSYTILQYGTKTFCHNIKIS